MATSISPTRPTGNHVDTLMQFATQRGFYLLVLPVWCRTYIEPTPGGSNGPDVVFTNSAKAYCYGQFKEIATERTPPSSGC